MQKIADLIPVALVLVLVAACSSVEDAHTLPLVDAAGLPDAAEAIDANAAHDAAQSLCEAVAREWCALNAQCGPFLPGDFPACVAEMSALCPGDTDDAPCLADLDAQWPDGPIECDEFAPVLPESCTWLVTP